MTEAASDNPEERRKFTRVNFDTVITLCQGDHTYQTHLLDISLNGVLTETPRDYSLNTEKKVEASLVLGEEETIEMSLELVHSSHNFLGFRCVAIDLPSITHLRRLIELNINDANASERVLSELIELHG